MRLMSGCDEEGAFLTSVRRKAEYLDARTVRMSAALSPEAPPRDW
jgi:hypothetical protein